MAAGAVAGADAPHLLVVHPDPLVSASLRSSSNGRAIVSPVAPSSQVALGVYQTAEQSFALVVAESMLPQLSGFDLARRILDRDSKARFVFLHAVFLPRVGRGRVAETIHPVALAAGTSRVPAQAVQTSLARTRTEK